MWLATGHTDMRKGFPGLSLQVQEVLRRDPLGGHLFCFRGRRSDLLKVIWHDGQGACLFTKRLERGRFLWPSVADGAVTISTAQMGYLLSGIDWRHPQESWRPTSRRMRVLGLKELANVIHSRYAIEACRSPSDLAAAHALIMAERAARVKRSPCVLAVNAMKPGPKRPMRRRTCLAKKR